MKRLIALAATFVILGCLLRAVDWTEVRTHLVELNLGWLAAALALFAVQVAVSSTRWQQLARGYGLGLREAVGHVLAASALNLAIPSKLGDLSKAGFLVRRPGGRGKAKRAPEKEGENIPGGNSPPHKPSIATGASPVSTSLSSAAGLVVLEKLLDVAALGGLLLVGLGLASPHPAASIAGALVFLGLAVLLCFGWHGRLIRPWLGLVDRLPERLRAVCFGGTTARSSYGWLQIGVLSLVLWSLHLLQIGLFFFAAGIFVTPAQVLSRVPLAIFAGLLPITVAGIGTRDSALVFLFLDTAAPAAVAVVGMLTALRYLIPGLAGLPVLALLIARDRRRAIEHVPAPHFSLTSHTASTSTMNI